MDTKDIRNLQEAYLGVYQEIDEAKVEAGASDVAKKDIRSRRFVGPEKEKDYDAMGSSASNWVSAARLRAHKASRGVKKEEVDIYDIILSHLLDEGYAETEEAAQAIMVNMSEEWRDSIVDEMLDEAKVEAGKSKEEKQKVRTARSGFTGPHAEYERRAKHRVADERSKDLADIRKGKKKDSSHFSYLP